MSNQGYRPVYKWDEPNLKQLNDNLRAMWKKVMGRVEMRDLSPDTQSTIESKADGEVVEEIREVADQAGKNAEQAKTEAGAAAQQVASMRTELDVTQEAITLKADKTTVDTLSGKVTENSAQLKVTAESVDSTVKRVETLNGVVTEHGTQIKQTADAITSTATAVEALDDRIVKAESAIEQTPEQIRMAVSQVQVGGRNLLRNTAELKTANHLIDESGASARGECTEDEFGGFHVVCKDQNIRCWMGDYAVTPGQSYAMSVRYKMNSGAAPIQFQYVLKSAGGADLYYWDSVNHSTTSTIAEDGWTVLRSVIIIPDNPAVAKVSLALRTGLDGWLYTCDYNIRRPKFEIGNKVTDWSPAPEDTDAAIDELSAALVVQAGEIVANATKIETVNQSAASAQNAANAAQNAAAGAQGTANDAVTRVTTAELSISALDEAVRTKVNQTDFNALGNRVSEAEGSITTQAGQIAAKVSQTDFNALGNRVSEAEGSITTQAGQIAAKVEKTEFDALGNKVNANTSAITQTANAIRSEVASSVSGLQTQIDQTDEQVLILAGRTVGGTNLVRTGEGTVGFINGHMDRNWEKSVWCRSGAGIILSPTADDYNGVHFYTDVKVAPGDYTLSFWCWTYGTDIQPVLRCNLFSSADGVDHYFKDIQTTANIPVRYEIPILVTYSATVNLRMLTWSKFTTGELYISDVKLESGNTSTAWSPYPEEFRAGSSVEITEKRVKIVSPETLIGIPGPDGDTMVAQFDEDGLTAKAIQAENIAYRYNGGVDIWVKADMSADLIARGNHYRSLSEALNSLTGRHITQDVQIHVQSDLYGDAELTGASGCNIAIHGNGCTLYGGVKMYNVSAGVDLDNLMINRPASSAISHALELSRCGYISMYNCKFIAVGADTAVNIGQGVRTFMHDCELRGADKLIYLWYCCDLQTLNLMGGECSKYLVINGATARLGGSRPDGTWEALNTSDLIPTDPNTLGINYGSATPSVPAIQTASWDYLYSDSYGNGWGNFADDDVRQGYISSGQIYGVMWFDAAAIRGTLSGKTINQVSLRLYMHVGVGRSQPVSVQLYGANVDYGNRVGRPSMTASYGTIGTTRPGEINEITIPAQAVADMVSGATNALVLLSDDAALYKDRSYSANYARFAGSTSATAENCPRLTVVYQ